MPMEIALAVWRAVGPKVAVVMKTPFVAPCATKLHEATAGEGAELDLCHVAPSAMLGGVVKLQQTARSISEGMRLQLHSSCWALNQECHSQEASPESSVGSHETQT